HAGRRRTHRGGWFGRGSGGCIRREIDRRRRDRPRGYCGAGPVTLPLPAEPADAPPASPAPGWAGLLNPGVTRREVWAWAMYDFANSGYTTVILTTVFSTYFVSVVGQRADWATLAWTAALSLSYLAIMLTMPALGARADARAAKRRLLFASTVGCVAATLALTRAGPGDVWLALAAVALSNYCYCVGESVVAAFLPEL